MVNMLIVLVCLVATSLGSVVRADDTNDLDIFSENTVGFDMKDDKAYFQDSVIDKHYKRSDFLNGRITLAGQSPDAFKLSVKASTYPFAVAQRSNKGVPLFDTRYVAERWDVKDFGENEQVELFALYHQNGNGKSNFVVNKVRAHLLRKLANAIRKDIPTLDELLQDNAAYDPNAAQPILDELTKKIENLFATVDQDVRDQMDANDDSSVSATVVIVTKHAIVTASVGNCIALGYLNSTLTQRLIEYEDEFTVNAFGARKSRSQILRTHVEIKPRAGFQLVVLGSPLVGQMNDDEIFRTIISVVQSHPKTKEHEQLIFTNSVSRILEACVLNADKGLVLRHFSSALDCSIILIGLERDYSMIH